MPPARNNWVPLAAWITTSVIFLVGGGMTYGESRALNKEARDKIEDLQEIQGELKKEVNLLRERVIILEQK